MENLTSYYKKLQETYSKLESLTKKLEEISHQTSTLQNLNDEDPRLMYQDALVWRFKFSCNLTCKYFEQYLFTRYGIKTNSPRSIFKELHKQRLITESEKKLLITVIADKSNADRTYNEIIVDALRIQISDHNATLKSLSNRFAP